MTRDEVVLALNAVVTQDGRVSGLSVLSTESHPREVNPILKVLSSARFEPGRMGASPVAVRPRVAAGAHHGQGRHEAPIAANIAKIASIPKGNR